MYSNDNWRINLMYNRMVRHRFWYCHGSSEIWHTIIGSPLKTTGGTSIHDRFTKGIHKNDELENASSQLYHALQKQNQIDYNLDSLIQYFETKGSQVKSGHDKRTMFQIIDEYTYQSPSQMLTHYDWGIQNSPTTSTKVNKFTKANNSTLKKRLKRAWTEKQRS